MPEKPQDAAKDQGAAQAPEAPDATKRLDETVPGGRYEVNGKIVDANGKPVKDA